MLFNIHAFMQNPNNKDMILHEGINNQVFFMVSDTNRRCELRLFTTKIGAGCKKLTLLPEYFLLEISLALTIVQKTVAIYLHQVILGLFGKKIAAHQ